MKKKDVSRNTVRQQVIQKDDTSRGQADDPE